jgi:acetyl esterase
VRPTDGAGGWSPEPFDNCSAPGHAEWMLHPQAVKAMRLWSLDPSPGDADFDIDTKRREGLAAAALDVREPVDHVSDVDADGVPCRLYRHQSSAGLIIGIHGGGFVFGEIETHDAQWRRVANRTGWSVLSVDYRRAPEHEYPAAYDDVRTAVSWVRRDGSDHGLDAKRLAAVGDSAGGHLALSLALDDPDLVAAGIVYPCLDPAGTEPSYRSETGGLTATEMDWYWSTYLNGQPGPDLLGADLTGMPPTLVVTAEHDPLRDEGERLAERLAAAGARVMATRYLGMIHGFWRWPQLFDVSDLAVRQLSAFLDGVVREG